MHVTTFPPVAQLGVKSQELGYLLAVSRPLSEWDCETTLYSSLGKLPRACDNIAAYGPAHDDRV